MEGLIILGFGLLVIFWIANALGRGSSETGVSDRARHRHDGDSHIYYYNDGNELVHECEGCSGCMENYANRLKNKGVRVQEVILGRHNSGELE